MPSHPRAAALIVVLVIGLSAVGARADAGSPGMNSTYQPTNQEFLARSFDGTEPVTTAMGGTSTPKIDIVTTPALTKGEVDIPVGGTVTFDASGSVARRNSYYGGQRLVDWVWDFQDGSQADAPVVTHHFDRQGMFRVTLSVHDDTGWQASKSTTVAVGDTPCGNKPQEIWIPTGPGLFMQGYVTVPAGAGPFPTILEYGPYVPVPEDPCSGTIRGGYARAEVSAPGRGRSTGEWDMFGRQTQRGGYDAVEWLAKQPWSNGKVGLYGLSGPAVAALLTAGSRPPHLACVTAMTSYSDLYRDMVTAGGVPNSDTFVNAWLHTLTVQDAQSAYANDGIAGVPSPVGPIPGIGPNGEVIDHGITNAERAIDLAAHPYYDSWWQERTITAYRTPNIPVLYYGNEHDLWPRATFQIAKWIAPGGGRVVQLQGGHGNSDVTGWQGPRDNALWFERFLKGVHNGVDTRPRVLTMTPYGGDAATAFSYGRWEALDGFLTNMVEPQRLYLRAANEDAMRPTYHGLSSDPSVDGELPAPLPYSPLQGATSDTTEGTEHQVAGLQESWESQSLVYETPVLDHQLPVNGPATLQVYARLLAPDFGFTAQIDDVWPDGSSHYVSMGALLASHRALDEQHSTYMTDGNGVRVLMQPWHPHTAESVQRLIPGQVYRFDIEIWSTQNVFLPGHRLRVALAAQDLGWRTHAEPGFAAIVMNDPAHPSTLNLPVLPPERSTSPFPFTSGGETTIGPTP